MIGKTISHYPSVNGCAFWRTISLKNSVKAGATPERDKLCSAYIRGTENDR